MALGLSDDIRYLKGVGEKRAALYRKLGIATARELLYHLPRDYIDTEEVCTLLTAQPGQPVALRLLLLSRSPEQRIRKGLSLHKLVATDNHATVTITFFNAKYTAEALEEGREYLFYGRLTGPPLRREMDNPQVFPAETQGLVPIYPLTLGLTQKGLRRDVARVLPLAEGLPDPLPGPLRRAHGLCGLAEALQAVHAPASREDMEAGRRRLVFEELFVLALGLSSIKAGRQVRPTRALEHLPLDGFWDALPFSPTPAQRRAIDDALGDLTVTRPMNRLIQGDVGSGKTLVAAACAYFVDRQGGQTALMTPTEILARQHFHTLSELLEPLGVRTLLLTGSMTAVAKRRAKAALAAGEYGLCVGTHALLTGDVEFSQLELVVTDEQHRFGVGQRAALRQKGRSTNMLVMSATPIPRTLALIIYGDLDVSVIDELPPGRTPVETHCIDSSKRPRAFQFIREHLDAGLQAYIVCPLIEQGEDTPAGLAPAADYARDVAAPAFAGYGVGLLHGRMKAAEKDDMMSRFAAGEIQLLIATTVIEVGVDVPNAVIMMVENAERFGLSQLHQLRGRVGRGRHQSYCILVSDARGEEARARLRTMRRTSDGFAIAEEDLRLRGPGDFFGYRQHGLPQLRVADLSADLPLLDAAQRAAASLLKEDPALASHPALAEAVSRMMRAVGELPN